MKPRSFHTLARAPLFLPHTWVPLLLTWPHLCWWLQRGELWTRRSSSRLVAPRTAQTLASEWMHLFPPEELQVVVSYHIDWQFLETKNSPGKKNYKLHHRDLSPKARTASLKESLNDSSCLLPGLMSSVEDTQPICPAGVSSRASSLGPQEVSDTGDSILFQNGESSRFLLAVPRSTSSWEDGQGLIHCF